MAADVVDDADVWVVEGGNRARLTFEALAKLGALRDVRGQNLDGDRTIEPRVSGLVDFTHSAGADRRDHLVVAKTCAALERHVWRGL